MLIKKITISLVILSLFFIVLGCKSVSITQANIKIIKSNKHPFLVDHTKLIIVEKGDKKIAQMYGYMDSGSGCDSNLFEEELYYIIIECNGTIYHLSKKDGQIENKGWSWMKQLPKKYVGTFVRQKVDEYKLVQKDVPTLEEVYKFKDPNN